MPDRIRIIGDIIECDYQPVAKILIGTSTLRDRLEEFLNDAQLGESLEEAFARGMKEGREDGYADGYREGKDENAD
jgi:flagellar biosynthesis/type III secretory pathway protein FliH